jgi:hypothetical protein
MRERKGFVWVFCPLFFFLSQILISNTWQPFLTTFHICKALQQKVVVVVVVCVACTFNEHDARDDDDDDVCERKKQHRLLQF